jgi:hypothetical protein
MFLPEEVTISKLVLGKREVRVLEKPVDGVGLCSIVNLVPDIRVFADLDAARHAAMALAEPFREAVARALQEQSVADPDRRDLFKKLAGGAAPPP